MEAVVSCLSNQQHRSQRARRSRGCGSRYAPAAARPARGNEPSVHLVGGTAQRDGWCSCGRKIGCILRPTFGPTPVPIYECGTADAQAVEPLLVAHTLISKA